MVRSARDAMAIGDWLGAGATRVTFCIKHQFIRLGSNYGGNHIWRECEREFGTRATRRRLRRAHSMRRTAGAYPQHKHTDIYIDRTRRLRMTASAIGCGLLYV